MLIWIPDLENIIITVVFCISHAYIRHQIKVRPNKFFSNKFVYTTNIILFGLVNRLIFALWIYDTIFAMYKVHVHITKFWT